MRLFSLFCINIYGKNCLSLPVIKDWIRLNAAVGADEEPKAGTGKRGRKSRKFEKDGAVPKSKKPRVFVEVMASYS